VFEAKKLKRLWPLSVLAPRGGGKTTIAPRQRITRPIRLRGGIASRNSAHHERPREDWIAIAVPPIVREEIFALAQERLEANKMHAPRRTVTPSVVQGLVSCAKCGYALYRTSTRSSARGAGRNVVGISHGAVSEQLMVSDQAARSIG
jgi:hypothetical protein